MNTSIYIVLFVTVLMTLILTADVVRKLTQLHNSDNIHDHDYVKSRKQPACASNSDKIDRPTTFKVLHAVQPAHDPSVAINDFQVSMM